MKNSGYEEIRGAERRRSEEAIDAARIMGFVAQINPYSLPPLLSNAEPAIITIYEEAGVIPDYGFATHIKLWQGLRDVVMVVHNAIDDHSEPLPEEDAIRIAGHDTSIDTIAYAAQLDEKGLTDKLHRQRNYIGYVSGKNPMQYLDEHDKDPRYVRRFIIDDEIGAIIQNSEYDDSWENHSPLYGCPFSHTTAKGERPKVFDDFARFAGTLAVRDYYEKLRASPQVDPDFY